MPWGSQGGISCQVHPGGYPAWGDTLEGGTLVGGTLVGGTLAGGYPSRGYPAQGGTLLGGGTQLGQHREYLLHGRWYASCVHAGGLSCLHFIYLCAKTIPGIWMYFFLGYPTSGTPFRPDRGQTWPGGTPSLLGGTHLGYPHQTWPGDTPSLLGVPHLGYTHQTWSWIPHPCWGYPTWGNPQQWVPPPPAGPGWGTPPPPTWPGLGTPTVDKQTDGWTDTHVSKNNLPSYYVRGRQQGKARDHCVITKYYILPRCHCQDACSEKIFRVSTAF